MAEAASALTFAGAYDESLVVLDEAAALLPAERVRERAEVVAKIAFAKRMSGRPLESRGLAQVALQSFPAESPSALVLRLELAIDRYWRGEFAHMYELARNVLRAACDCGEQLLTSWAAALCSLADISRDRTSEAAAELQDAELAFSAVSDEELAEHIDVAGYLAQAAAALERTDDALDHVRRGLRLARSTGQSPFVPGMLVLETNALFMKGRVTEAMVVAETATDAAVLTGNDQFAVWALWADAVVCSCAGDTARALASAREAAARSERVDETFFSTLSRLYLAAALHAAGDPAGARSSWPRSKPVLLSGCLICAADVVGSCWSRRSWPSASSMPPTMQPRHRGPGPHHLVAAADRDGGLWPRCRHARPRRHAGCG